MKALLLLVNNFMKTQLEVLTEILDSIADSGSIVSRRDLLDKITWEVNRYLVPSSLDLIQVDEIRNLFYSLLENYINSANQTKSMGGISRSIQQMTNRPIGGRWIMLFVSIGIWKLVSLSPILFWFKVL